MCCKIVITVRQERGKLWTASLSLILAPIPSASSSSLSAPKEFINSYIRKNVLSAWRKEWAMILRFLRMLHRTVQLTVSRYIHILPKFTRWQRHLQLPRLPYEQPATVLLSWSGFIPLLIFPWRLSAGSRKLHSVFPEWYIRLTHRNFFFLI